VTTLFFWQLVGDVLKVLIDFRLSVFANYSGFIVTELLSLSIILSSIFSLNLWSRRSCNGACLDVFRILISACGLF
jgi:hypothetical protein